MRPHVDLVLCLLPFEPDSLRRLSGPPGVYVGHPLIEHLPGLRPSAAELQTRHNPEAFQVALLPGSRRSELRHHMAAFGDAVALMAASWPGAAFVLPTLPHLEALLAQAMANWPVRPQIVVGEAARHAAFRSARAALAASGTVTLELGLSGVPLLSCYRFARFEAAIARLLVRLDTASLVNLVLDQRIVPEVFQEQVVGDVLARRMHDILSEGPARRAQLDALSRLPARLAEGLAGLSPSGAAAQAVLRFLADRPPADQS
jgi:lipid-A-disaccharide synthase